MKQLILAMIACAICKGEIEPAAGDLSGSQILEKSELVCVAFIEVTEISGSHGVAGLSLDVKITEVLKGPKELAGKTIQAGYGSSYDANPDRRIEVAVPDPKTKTILFLRKAVVDGESVYFLVDDIFGFLPYTSTTHIWVDVIQRRAEHAEKEKGAAHEDDPAIAPESK